MTKSKQKWSESNTTDLVVVNTCLILCEADYYCGFLLFVQEPSLGRGVRQRKKDDEPGQDSNGAVDQENILRIAISLTENL